MRSPRLNPDLDIENISWHRFVCSWQLGLINRLIIITNEDGKNSLFKCDPAAVDLDCSCRMFLKASETFFQIELNLSMI